MMPVLSQGDEGDQVVVLGLLLTYRLSGAYVPGASVDVFDHRMKMDLMRFQREYVPKKYTPGVCEASTWEALLTGGVRNHVVV